MIERPLQASIYAGVAAIIAALSSGSLAAGSDVTAPMAWSTSTTTASKTPARAPIPSKARPSKTPWLDGAPKAEAPRVNHHENSKAPPTSTSDLAHAGGVTAKTLAEQSLSRPLEAKPASPEYQSAVQKFCSNIIPAAIEARHAWEHRAIAEADQAISIRIRKLDAKIEEAKAWMSKRDEFSAKANAALIQVFNKIKPEAAALQITEMDDMLAAAIIMKLEPKIAAPIVAEIAPVKAALIARLLSAAATQDKRIEPERNQQRSTQATTTPPDNPQQ